MKHPALKIRNLLLEKGRLERLRTYAEIQANQLLFSRKPENSNRVLSFTQFIERIRQEDSNLYNVCREGGEAEAAVGEIRSQFETLMRGRVLPFPMHFNADKSLAMLCYSYARLLRPEVVLETGVGYGICSALVLLAMERGKFGRLLSTDLPSLADPRGLCIGVAIPKNLRHRWTLHTGSSRAWLPRLTRATQGVGLFVSDSANVYTLQRFEFLTVWRKLGRGGVVILNDISDQFLSFLNAVTEAKVYFVRQVEKRQCVTGLVVKG